MLGIMGEKERAQGDIFSRCCERGESHQGVEQTIRGFHCHDLNTRKINSMTYKYLKLFNLETVIISLLSLFKC